MDPTTFPAARAPGEEPRAEAQRYAGPAFWPIASWSSWRVASGVRASHWSSLSTRSASSWRAMSTRCSTCRRSCSSSAVGGRGKYWTVVTSQEKLSELVSGLDDKKIELARLMDRFPLQVHLEPSDIAGSDQGKKRVLQKERRRRDATLGEPLRRQPGAVWKSTPRSRPTFRLPTLSRERVVDLYPLLPYQIDLIIDIVVSACACKWAQPAGTSALARIAPSSSWRSSC